MKRALGYSLLGTLMLAATALRASAVTFGVDPSYSWVGYMNRFELPENGGGYAGGEVWTTADLRANFTGATLKLEAAPIPTGDSFWYVNGVGGPGAAGNKNMEAIFYVEQDGTLGGQTVTFTGNVLANTLVSPYVAKALIRDFAPDYSSFTETTVDLTPGVFSVTATTDPGAGRHVQYGFSVFGPNVWPTDVESKGFVTVTALSAAGVTGDYSNNGTIDAADYTAWKNAFNGSTLPNLSPTKVGTTIDASDYTVWRDVLPVAVANSAAVPEPSLWAWIVVAGVVLVGTRRRSAS